MVKFSDSICRSPGQALRGSDLRLAGRLHLRSLRLELDGCLEHSRREMERMRESEVQPTVRHLHIY